MRVCRDMEHATKACDACFAHVAHNTIALSGAGVQRPKHAFMPIGTQTISRIALALTKNYFFAALESRAKGTFCGLA